jgi:ketosteroid isomerase-like protein
MRKSSRNIALLVILAAGLSLSSRGQSSPAQTREAAIRAVLASQVKAWNQHDLEGFMAGYWNSPALTFFSGATETKGWQATLERYRKKYQAPDSDMGKLEMTDIRVELLGPQGGFVRGKWQLTRSNGKQPHGLFTLIFREFPEGWRITHDHTSSE